MPVTQPHPGHLLLGILLNSLVSNTGFEQLALGKTA
jgi:hypothetical protein